MIHVHIFFVVFSEFKKWIFFSLSYSLYKKFIVLIDKPANYSWLFVSSHGHAIFS